MSLKTKLMTSVAALSLIGTAATAQETTEMPKDAPAEMAQSEYAPGWNANLDTTYGDIADERIADLVGINVVTEGGDDVGEVDTFVMIDGDILAVVGVGGFLGIGEHDVALPLSDLSYNGDDIVIAYSNEELEAMPEYDETVEQTAFNDDDTFRTRTAPVVAEGYDVMPTDEDSTAMDMADGTIEDAGEAMAPTGEEVAAAEEAAGGADTMTEEIAEAEKGPIEQETEEMAAELDSVVTGATESTAEMAENAAEATGEALDHTGQDLADATDAAVDTMDSWADQVQAKFASLSDATVGDVTAYDVATVDGDVVGDIEHLAVQNDKVVALVGIGGFLGLGEHDVALELDRLSFDGEKFIVDGYTEAELENLTEYSKENVTIIESDVTLRSAM